MDSKMRNVGWLVVAALGAGVIIPMAAEAQESRGGTRASSTTEDPVALQKEIEKTAKGMGPWERHRAVITEATDNMFRQKGWNSESDVFTRGVLRDVEQLPPWQYQERQEVFMNHMQTRYNLGEEDKTFLSGQMQREMMAVGIKHFRTMAPMMMEIIKLRSQNLPFTPDLVQKWSRNLDPVMADAKIAVEKVAARLAERLDPQARKQLKADMKALVRRHDDMVASVQDWKKGKWTPTEWGLQNDPIHGRIMQRLQAVDDEKTTLTEIKEARDRSLDTFGKDSDESTWKKYVRMFCIKYECDTLQTDTAHGIRRSSEREAKNSRDTRKKDIEKLESLLAAAETDKERAYYQRNLDRQLKPITLIFDRMCRKLVGNVLTSKQRLRFVKNVKQ